MGRPLRIALLSYRAHPEVGGQGVYVRSLARALRDRSHRVTVFSGQPFPILDEGIELHEVPSLDLYRPDDPFRRPGRKEFRDGIDALEYGLMCTGAFPEPLTFSLRVHRVLRERVADFDVVHDNQTLGYGLLRSARHLPLVATIHHPISVDRRLALAEEEKRGRRFGLRRWYSFVRMQARVARRMPRLIAVSESSRRDAIADFGVAHERITVVPNGVDTDLFRPLPRIRRVPGRVLAIASSDQPSKGLEFLAEAVAKLSTERDVELVVIGRGGLGRAFRSAVTRLDIEDIVQTPGRLSALDLVEHLARAQVAVVPSLYEGFSLPAVEAMSAGTPLVTTTGGALPEVVGDAGLSVAPGDAGALAAAIARLLDRPERAEALGALGRQRALERYSWLTTAASIERVYREAMATC